MKADISIIIPIYKGGQYIPYWLEKIEKNTVRLDAFHLKCELILVNDFPEEHIKMEDFQPCGFTLKILNAEKNQGIHGARVYGLEHAEGEWVVFLDQDDWIVDDYLLKQKLCIGDADAVICNGYFKYFCMDICNFIYKDMEEQKRVKDLSFYISTGNPVYSPGQVMLKRKAVPQFWCQNRLKMNGADDYYLWILMLKAGKEFVLNKEKLYTHVGHGSNASNDIASMTCSIREVEEILETKGFLNDLEKEMIHSRKIPGWNRHKSADIIMVYDYWMYLEHRKQSVADYFRDQGYFKIGIYGMSSVGNRLCDLLADSDIKTVFAIDRRARKFICAIPVFCPEDEQVKDYVKQVDAIIVTAESAFESIRKEMKKRYRIPVLSFKNILLKMIEKVEQGAEGDGKNDCER